MNNPLAGACLCVLLASLGACAARHPAPATPSNVATLLKPAPEGQAPIEATSLLGQPLRRPPIDPEKKAKLEKDLVDAAVAAQLCATCCDETIWYGRRLGYLHMYKAAVDVYTQALRAQSGGVCARHKLHRHLGHRLITLRRIDEAITHLTQAASLVEIGHLADEVEPDGAPNEKNIPLSTTNGNIYYHLGLAHYLKGNFAAAERAYRACMPYATNDDMRIATMHWLYMTLRRQGKNDEAASLVQVVPDQMTIIENHAYYACCLMYRGLLTPENLLNLEDPDPVQNLSAQYGLANWYVCEGRPAEARPILEKLAGDPNWPAFAVIAAEADLARGVAAPPRR